MEGYFGFSSSFDGTVTLVRACARARGYTTTMPKRGIPMRVQPDFRQKLDTLIGKNGERALEELKALAEGQVVKVNVPVAGIPGAYTVLEVAASVRERIYVWELLLAYQQGRPKQQVAIEHSTERRRYDPSKLSLKELEQLKALEEKAFVPALEAGAIDAEFTEEEETEK